MKIMVVNESGGTYPFSTHSSQFQGGGQKDEQGTINMEGKFVIKNMNRNGWFPYRGKGLDYHWVGGKEI